MNDTRPIIGLTPQVDIEHFLRPPRIFPQYLSSIERAGGVGIVLPLTQNVQIMKMLADLCSGFLFTGGQDLEPSLYGEEEDEDLTISTGYAPERDAFESAFYPIAKATGKPILAICRGFQVINVLHGGTIIQDLPVDLNNPEAVLHSAWAANPGEERLHSIIVTPDTLLQKVEGKNLLQVNSYHHQGIKQLGKGLTMSGKSTDGLIEAYDIDDLDFGLAVQWHPEVLYDRGQYDGGIFKEFIKACKQKQQTASLLDRSTFKARGGQNIISKSLQSF